MSYKTNQAIDAEVEALKKIKPNIRRHSVFGDDHHAAIDVVIAVLQGRMDQAKVHATYGVQALGDDFNEVIFDEALAAHYWMADDGFENDPPSGPEWWGGLVQTGAHAVSGEELLT